jgi:hypothetical protein
MWSLGACVCILLLPIFVHSGAADLCVMLVCILHPIESVPFLFTV